jgi:hypothetical protein
MIPVFSYNRSIVNPVFLVSIVEKIKRVKVKCGVKLLDFIEILESRWRQGMA